uniref:CCDC50_N domain-containing protein n=1 Tax=Echinostoma caproni TaxID=27848 RepID=A0A183B5E7_9TREM
LVALFQQQGGQPVELTELQTVLVFKTALDERWMLERNVELGFLDKFGENEGVRLRRRAELARDYEEFKKKDEEKFKNRFADKKRVTEPKTKELNEESLSYLNESSTPRAHVQNEKLDVSPGHRQNDNQFIRNSEGDVSISVLQPNSLKTFEERIAQLTEKIDLLYQSKNTLSDRVAKQYDPTSGCKSVSTTNDNERHNGVDDILNANQLKLYEQELHARLKMIKDAEERLSMIEKEYRETKLDSEKTYDDNPTADTTLSETKIINSREKVPMSNIDFMPAERFMTPESKYLKQKAYREDLERQILEAKSKKMAEKEKDDEVIGPKGSVDANYFTGKQLNSRKEIPINHVLSYSQPHKGDQEYLLYGQNDLINSISMPQNSSASYNSHGDVFFKPESTNFLGSTNTQPNSSQNSKKLQYAQELRQQIEEARKKKELQKKKDEELDRKIEKECESYDPFDTGSTKIHLRPSLNSTELNNHIGEDNYARGGHGIFGSPLTDEQKTNLQKYKDDLAQQIAEKKRAAEMQRQRELELERKETERLEAEQLRMKKEYEEEQARLKAKQEEAERFAEQQRKEGEMRKKAKLEEIEKLKAKSVSEEPIRYSKQEDENHKKKHKQKRQTERLKSPELLIGPDRFSKTRDVGKPKAITDQESSPIIKQLNNLRTQLDIEKQKLENALLKTRNNNGNEAYANTDEARWRPRVSKKGSFLFSKDEHPKESKNIHTNITTKNWVEELVKEEDRALMEKNQASYLQAQDEYLTELKDSLALLSLQEIQNDAKLKAILNENQENSVRHISRNSSEDLDERPSKLTPRSVSVSSVNLEEIAAKNEQRLKRLEAMQLLNDIDADPEAVLQRFIEKHDEVQPNKHKFYCY